MEQLQSRSEARVAQCVVATAGARRGGRGLAATLAAAAARLAGSRAVPPRLRGPLLLRVLRLLRQRERLLEEYFTSPRPHPACPPPPRPPRPPRALRERWGLPPDTWVCPRCGGPRYDIIPFEEGMRRLYGDDFCFVS
ncbi:hypothetical protein JYU34_013949 [Plutella xylostella]|uniref:Uncharacterized protein n=1 Tax=Plutella xylostella TaxID=51655 RepID=A0ABQ7QCC2_PLUXY|nr:hypothetical protein JYU34_013949 [Plutella xylostella]